MTKEVPVDRVVKHEVPIQTIKKEIVLVPFYTNDPKLLKMGVEKEAQLSPSDNQSRDGES